MAGWLFKRRIIKLRESIYTILFYITTFTLACISLNVIEKGMAFILWILIISGR